MTTYEYSFLYIVETRLAERNDYGKPRSGPLAAVHVSRAQGTTLTVIDSTLEGLDKLGAEGWLTDLQPVLAAPGWINELVKRVDGVDASGACSQYFMRRERP